MKRHAIAVSIQLGLFLLAAAAPGHAQQPLRVKIPFDFVADKATLPAGEYIVQPARIGSSVLIVQRIDSRKAAAAMVMSNPVEATARQRETCLVFRVSGERYFLSEVWTDRASFGRQLGTSPIEKMLAKNEIPHEVIVLANLQERKR
jgi:quinol monooxygenase YgiN